MSGSMLPIPISATSMGSMTRDCRASVSIRGVVIDVKRLSREEGGRL